MRILLVEDHESTRVVMARLLGIMGHDVIATESVADALGAASRNAFDLVVSDLGLPDGDGCELMRKLAARFGLKGVALTGYSDDGSGIASDGGFVAHLTKPVDAQTLQSTIQRVTV